MGLRIFGLPPIITGLKNVSEALEDTSLITEDLAEGMRRYAHVATGYLRSTVYHEEAIAGASAPYAGFEADRGGEHDFAQKAVDAFKIDEYADMLVKEF